MFGAVDTHIAGQVQNPDTSQRLGGVLAPGPAIYPSVASTISAVVRAVAIKIFEWFQVDDWIACGRGIVRRAWGGGKLERLTLCRSALAKPRHKLPQKSASGGGRAHIG